MTKTKANRCITKAATSKTSATKRATRLRCAGLLVLGFDEQQKPCGARFVGQAGPRCQGRQLMGLRFTRPRTGCRRIAKKLPIGQLYANGRGFVPNVRQTLYSDVLLRWRPNRSRPRWDRRRQGQHPCRPWPAGQLGRDRAWPPRHRQESLANGWWEASCSTAKTTCSRCGFAITRGSRFFRHRTAVALMSPAAESRPALRLACRKQLGPRERPGPLPSSSWPTSSASLNWRSDHGHEDCAHPRAE